MDRKSRNRPSRVNEVFHLLAHQAARAAGTPWAFIAGLGAIIVWGITGPLFGFSDTWQLVVNTATTIITFLMVFLIQNTQNRDAEVLQLKLDELIRAVKGARNQLIDLEEMSESEIRNMEEEFRRLRRGRSRSHHVKRGDAGGEG